VFLIASPEEQKVFHSANPVKYAQEVNVINGNVQYPVEYLNSINASSLPLSMLSLTIGCPIMIL